jgi:hypothetical protein
MADAAGNPRRHPTRSAHDAGNWYGVAEDDTWVLFLVAARTLRRLGQPLPPAWLAFADDPRATVRRAFATITAQPALAATAAPQARSWGAEAPQKAPSGAARRPA